MLCEYKKKLKSRFQVHLSGINAFSLFRLCRFCVDLRAPWFLVPGVEAGGDSYNTVYTNFVTVPSASSSAAQIRVVYGPS